MAKLNGLGKWWKHTRWLRPASGIFLVLGLGLAEEGCTRRFYRHEADKEVEQVLGEKDKYPAWTIDQFHVYPDPHSRFADPTNPDRPPKPPDDPAAFDLAPNPQKPGHAGIALVEGTGYLDLLDAWDKENRAEAATQRLGGAGRTEAETQEGGGQREPGVEGTPEGKSLEGGQQAYAGAAAASTTSLSSKPKPGQRKPYLLKLEQAVELGLVNSREYQDARENLYLTALPVTLQRFSFAAQFFAAGQAIRNWASGTAGNNWTVNDNVGFAKLFPTGALMLFNFANQTVIGLANVGTTSRSTINLDIVQPFLRGGGRAVTLEPLTQAERDLVYGIRDYARFREEFFVAIAGGGGGSITGANFQPTGVIASPTFSPTGGVNTTTSTVPGLIASVPALANPGLQVTPGPSGRILLQTALAAPVSGYLSTLLEAAQMRVDEYNIQKLEEYLQLARAMEEGGDISRLQVDQFEQQLLGRRSTLLGDQLQYLNSLDQFKLQLGLPTDLPIELEDSPFRPLNLQFRQYENLFNEYDAASVAPERFGTAEQVAQVRPELRRLLTNSPLTRATQFRTQVITSWDVWQKLTADQLAKRLQILGEERRRIMARQTELETKGQAITEAERKRLEEVNFEIDVGTFEDALRTYETQPWKNALSPEARTRQQRLAFRRYILNTFISVLTAARNERIVGLRTQWPDLARLCVDGVDLIKADLDDAQAAVIQHALLNRMDLMNVRGALVDAWRQVAIFANALLGTFNVAYNLSSSTPAGTAQAFTFSGANTMQSLSFNWELPLARKAERNAYRACLINYQRFRRVLQAAEDRVAFDTRGEIRSLRQLEENYRIQQRQIELGYMTVENALDTFRAPPQPGAAFDAATRAASLTQQLLQAQQQLYQAQFTMTTIWINYLNTRLQLYRDMELMPLDYRGVWIDEVATRECPGGAACGSPQPSPAGAGGSQGASAGERPEQLPGPRPGAPTEKPALEQTHENPAR
jgi:outer membrane protein TolC